MANSSNNLWDNNMDAVSVQSSNYGDVTTHDNGQIHMQVVKKVVSGTVVIDGYLKKMKKYLMSSKNFYRVVGKVMLVASNPKKQFTEKYDLSNYQIQLSQGDPKKFYLYPIHENLQLNTVRFITDTVDDRARWYKALSQICTGNVRLSQSAGGAQLTGAYGQYIKPETSAGAHLSQVGVARNESPRD